MAATSAEPEDVPGPAPSHIGYIEKNVDEVENGRGDRLFIYDEDNLDAFVSIDSASALPETWE